MFGAVVGRGFAKKRKPLLKRSREFGINWDMPQRRLPSSLAHDRQRLAHTGVIGTHQDTALGNLHTRIDCPRHMTRVHVSGVAPHPTKSWGRLLAARCVGLDL